MYNAIRKYGIEHFHIHLIEETDNLNEREIYWINFYNSYNNGYNATYGGEGTCKFNHTQIIELYKQYLNCSLVARIVKCTPETVSNIVKSANIVIKHPQVDNKPINQYTKAHDFVQSFQSCGDAARYLVTHKIANGTVATTTAKITGCARRDKNRKTAYGFIWEYEV